jgi:hypothetical protein
MRKPRAIVINDEEGLAVRCYNLESGYAYQVTQDLIDAAVEANS